MLSRVKARPISDDVPRHREKSSVRSAGFVMTVSQYRKYAIVATQHTCEYQSPHIEIPALNQKKFASC